MIDPNLKRAVWLTEDQRNEVLNAAIRAHATVGSNIALCENVIAEIQSVDDRLMTLHSKITAVVKLLNLPADALPVYLSHMEIEEIVFFGELDLDLADFIDPPIPQNIFYDAPRYD